MHFKSLLHVRDHSKARGTAHHLLEYIALHVNYRTGEAFDLTVERLAHRLDVTPQWVGQLKARLVATGELIVKQSRGRHPNVYVIPTERCPACQEANPKLEVGDDFNPKVPASQPQSRIRVNRASGAARAPERFERSEREKRKRANPKVYRREGGQTRTAQPFLV